MTKKQIVVSVGAEVTVQNYSSSFGETARQHLVYGHRETIYVQGSVESLIKDLQRIRREYGKEHTNLCIEEIRDCGCYHDCSCSPSLFIQGTRLENDVEYNFRIAEEKRHADEVAVRDQAEFERLKAKFDKA